MAFDNTFTRKCSGLGSFRPTYIHHSWTTRMESTPTGKLQQSRCHTGNSIEYTLVLKVRQTANKRLGIWMFGISKHIPDIAQLHEPPCIHHRHFVHKLCHQSHIMTNQDYSRTNLFLHAVNGFHYL